MNFLEADVTIKVDDSKLPAQLARAKSAVTRTVTKISATFKRMAVSFKAAFDKMVRIAKYAAVGIAAALTLATRAAMKQEDAQFLLMAALKISGEYTKALEERFKAFAASVQQATIYGDEEVLALMQLQKSLGVTADKLELAAKQAIGLATATGRDIKSMAMYIALAQQGEFTMLRRYIPALRATTDKTEQLEIITRVCAEGFKLAEERAKTASGGLRQMWNALGDVAEVIGGALLPVVKDTARDIKEWAERNQERIGEWAKEVVRYVGLAKDVFVDWVSYLKQDMKRGVDIALRVSLELFKGFWHASVVIMHGAGKEAANAFTVAFGDTVADWYGKVGEKLWFLPGVSLPARGMAAILRGRERAPVGEESKRVFEELEEIAKVTAVSIKSIMEEMEPAKTIREQYIEVLRAKIAMIDEELTAVNEAIKEAVEEALVAPVVKAEDKIKKLGTELKRVHQDIASAMARSWSDALDKMMFESKKFGDAMKDMFRSLLRMITQIIMYEAFARPVAETIMAAIPGALIPAGGEPSAQHGGTVERTGWAKVHKGETFSGVGGGRLEVNVNYSGQERPVVSEAEFDFRRQVLNITMDAAQSDGPYRRSHNLRR